MRRSLSTPSAFVLVLLAAILGACTQENDPLGERFPLPVITEARQVDSQTVQLAWNAPNPEGVDEFRLYVGLYANLGFTVLDVDSLYTTTSETSYTYVDPGLAFVDSGLCEQAGLCDTLAAYAYFRVSAVRAGVESDPGPRAFIDR